MELGDFKNGYLRAENIFHLMSQGQGEALIDDIFDIYENDMEELQDVLKLDFKGDYDMDKEELSWHLHRSKKKGFLVQMATPVPSNFDERGGFMTNGWGYYSTKYFYAETLDDCYSQAAIWQEEYYAQVKEKEAF